MLLYKRHLVDVDVMSVFYDATPERMCFRIVRMYRLERHVGISVQCAGRAWRTSSRSLRLIPSATLFLSPATCDAAMRPAQASTTDVSDPILGVGE